LQCVSPVQPGSERIDILVVHVRRQTHARSAFEP
jgi:hypothetical protein